MDLNDKLYSLYERASDYINRADCDTIPDIIKNGADIFVEHEDELAEMPSVAEVLGACLIHINKWFEDDEVPTLEEYEDDGYELVEEISGTLGEFFE